MEEYKLIDKLFEYRQDDNIADIQNDIIALKNKVKGVKQKEIIKLISNLSQDNINLKEKLIESIDNLVEDYNIMLAYYNKKYYKQGFEDALEIERKCKQL